MESANVHWGTGSLKTVPTNSRIKDLGVQVSPFQDAAGVLDFRTLALSLLPLNFALVIA